MSMTDPMTDFRTITHTRKKVPVQSPNELTRKQQGKNFRTEHVVSIDVQSYEKLL